MVSYERWAASRERVDALPADRQAAFALACAAGAVGDRTGLLAALEGGWSALVDGTDVTEVVLELARGQELDDDPVAATGYALCAVQGEAGAAWWAASRAVDHAFAGVRYDAAESAFRSLEVDAQDPFVRAEFARQAQLLQVVESATDLSEAVARLRA
ncbi:hypothetical protein ACQE98_11575 [Ornithinimicrobium sp. W1679]|uniref:hypothetical protein n=1 Tax=Ornithinimicrobium sp. W1679 TaxID=3418770 RepID=UPI003CECB6D6